MTADWIEKETMVEIYSLGIYRMFLSTSTNNYLIYETLNFNQTHSFDASYYTEEYMKNKMENLNRIAKLKYILKNNKCE